MNLTLLIKLQPNADQAQALLLMMERFNGRYIIPLVMALDGMPSRPNRPDVSRRSVLSRGSRRWARTARFQPNDWLGVDLGIVHLAADSKHEIG